jgi:hypothetical protein
MSVTNKIIDGHGSGQIAKVDDGGYLRVQPAPFPPVDDRDTQIIFREFLTLNGNGTTSDMRVNGITAPQLFYIQAQPEFDIYITSLSFLLADTDVSPVLEEFGALTALTNGVRLYYEDSNGEIDIAGSLKSNFEIIRLCQGTPAFGSGADGFFAEAVTSGAGNQFAIIPILNFQTIFGFQYGLRLRSSTTNRLVLSVRDNISTGLDAFNIIAYGFKRKID